MPELLEKDIEHILDSTHSIWKELSGGRLFLTGGSGYAGRWLLESFAKANERFKLDAQAVVLSRDPEALARRIPGLVPHPSIRVIGGDVRSFAFPDGRFTHIIHAAAESDPRTYAEHPMRMLGMMLSGTRRVLDFALQSGAGRFLLVSSGAVYGPQPHEMDRIPENYAGEPDVRDPGSAFAEGKRISETLCLTYTQHYGLQVKIARCFYSFGPFMRIDSSMPPMRYLRDGLMGGPLVFDGIGKSCSSYLYGADLAIWLWTILARGESGRAYNVGSEQAVSNAELARLVGQAFDPPLDVRYDSVTGQEMIAERYVPSTRAARERLQLEQRIPLPQALQRTLSWLRQNEAQKEK